MDYNCTADELAAVALYNVAPFLAEFPEIDDAVAEPNIVSFMLMTLAINKPMPKAVRCLEHEHGYIPDSKGLTKHVF